MEQLVDAVAQGERRPGEERTARRDQCPEVRLSPMSQGVPLGGRPGAASLSDEHEEVVGGIGE